jgi:hypothetical protein
MVNLYMPQPNPKPAHTPTLPLLLTRFECGTTDHVCYCMATLYIARFHPVICLAYFGTTRVLNLVCDAIIAHVTLVC